VVGGSRGREKNEMGTGEQQDAVARMVPSTALLCIASSSLSACRGAIMNLIYFSE
jgi:hypothetical protein